MVAVLNRDEEDEGHTGLGWAISASWAKTRLGRRNVTRWVDKRVWAEMELGHEEKENGFLGCIFGFKSNGLKCFQTKFWTEFKIG
jgi:hypothetical protein